MEEQEIPTREKHESAACREGDGCRIDVPFDDADEQGTGRQQTPQRGEEISPVVDGDGLHVRDYRGTRSVKGGT